MTDIQHDFPRIRADLKWTLHQFADGASYTVVNPTTGLNYQVGLAEYAFASMLDGHTSIEDAAAATRDLADNSGKPELAINVTEGEMIAGWLLKMKLTTICDQQLDTTRQRRRTHFSALSIKMPLADPTRVIDALARFAWPLTTKPAFVGSLVLIAAALIQVLCDLGRWSVALEPLADANTWWILGAVALALRVLHEAAHGVVAKRFDVRVGEMGILWILLMPLPYVDVSACWQRNRRRERILIAAAGMLAEMAIAAIAVFIFTWSTSEIVQHVAATVALTASVVTVLFNANVLMRFDGYHILVDASGLPNLYSDASSYWRGLAMRIVLGKSVQSGPVPLGWRGVFFRAYGLGAIVWRIVVFVGLVLAAEHLLGGAGVVLGLAAVVALVVKQILGLPRVFATARPLRALLGLVVSTCIVIAIWKSPLSLGRTETGVVRYYEPNHVRAGADGFVRELLVRCGQVVQAGDPLVTLENAALESEVETLGIQLAAAEMRYRLFLSENEMASVEAQWSSVIQIRGQLAQRTRQLEGLTIRAESDGVVTARDDLSLWLGRFIREGTELMRVVRSDEMEIVFLVDQQTRGSWAENVGRQVRIRRPIDWRDNDAILSEVAPRATDRLPSDALGAHQGGSLAVRPSPSRPEEVRLLQPRFEARLRPSDWANELHDGERILVSLEEDAETVGEVICDTATDWLQSRIARHSLLHQLSNF